MPKILGMKAQTWGFSSRRTKWYDISSFGTDAVTDWPPIDGPPTTIQFNVHPAWDFNGTSTVDFPCFPYIDPAGDDQYGSSYCNLFSVDAPAPTIDSGVISGLPAFPLDFTPDPWTLDLLGFSPSNPDPSVAGPSWTPISFGKASISFRAQRTDGSPVCYPAYADLGYLRAHWVSAGATEAAPTAELDFSGVSISGAYPDDISPSGYNYAVTSVSFPPNYAYFFPADWWLPSAVGGGHIGPITIICTLVP